MVRKNLKVYEGKRIVVEGQIEKTYKDGHNNVLIKNIVIKRDGQEEDHIWVCNNGHEGNGIVREVLINRVQQKVGDKVQLRGVVVPYRKGRSVDYAIEQIDAIGVNGRVWKVKK